MSDTVESEKDYKDDARRWLDALRIAGKNQEPWEQRAEKIEKRYRDERSEAECGTKKFNILWSNVQTLRPAVYARTPQPVVTRRFKDADPTGRQASMIIERAAEYSLDAYDFDDVMKSVVEDRLLPGRGVARVLYEPTMGTATDLDGNEYEEVVYEEAKCEYVYWRDFRHGTARKWSQVPWVAFRTYLTRKELTKRFKDKANDIPLSYKPEGCDDEDEQFKKAKIWEIWSKTDSMIYWVAEDHDEILDSDEPYLNLRNFFPCPKPLYSTTTNTKLVPVPDFVEYQDQADELDELTNRINKLIESLKVAGVYASDAKEVSRLLEEGLENELVPVEDWAMFAERGGLDGMISWLPIDQVANTVLRLYEAREQTKQELYEITGLADIIRGASQAQETATAQRIKGQFATLRLSDTQADVAKFARDLIELKAEIMCEHFAPQTLQMMTGLEITPEVIQLINNDAMRTFRIDIETDSTINIDEQADKEARVEFMNTASMFLERAIPAYQAMPQLGPLLGEMLMFGIRGFKAGRELEDSFEEAMTQMAQAPQQEGPDPEEQKAQQELQIQAEEAKQDMQINSAEHQQKMKQKQELHLLDLQQKAQKVAMNDQAR